MINLSISVHKISQPRTPMFQGACVSMSKKSHSEVSVAGISCLVTFLGVGEIKCSGLLNMFIH